MFDRKFVLGILMGGILGLTVAGLQPLRSPALAQAPSSDAALLREVQAIRQQLSVIAKSNQGLGADISAIKGSVAQMSKDIRTLDSRNSLSTPQGVN
jgi:gas vesicle protein